VKWFGKSWGAECCTPEDHVPVPVGEPCENCGEAIEDGDQGFSTAVIGTPLDVQQTVKTIHYHHDCFLVQVVGTLGHQAGRCSCYGGTESNPPELTRREAATAAVRAYQMRRSGGLRAFDEN
jgi:hypothetical protein